LRRPELEKQTASASNTFVIPSAMVVVSTEASETYVPGFWPSASSQLAPTVHKTQYKRGSYARIQLTEGFGGNGGNTHDEIKVKFNDAG